MEIRFKFRVLIVLTALLSSPLFAQDAGTVAGVVVSSWDGSVLAGAAVTVRGTTLAGQSDASGQFQLSGVPPGDQVLRISKSGYAAAVVTDVRVLPGQTTTVNGNLRPEFYEMEEYEVTAEEFTQQTEQILIERQQSSAMIDALGSEQFSKLGAGDAAEALGKVSGASIADGKFAVIRGLADRYTSTTLNGNDFPSADPDRKAAQLDLLPAQVIERMDVSKTFSPDMAGGFAGGAINIVTKSYPEKFLFTSSAGASYNTQANLNENFLASDPGGTDWLAMDDGTRALPEVAENSNPAGGSPLANQPAIKRSFKSKQFSPLARESGLNKSFSMAVGDSVPLGWFKLGYLASVNYKNEYKFYDNGIVRRYVNPTTVTKDKTDTKGVAEYTWSASAAVTLGLGENHEVKLNYLYVQAAEDEARRLRGQDDGAGTVLGESYLDQSLLHWTERNLTYYQLAGRHAFPELNEVKLEWAGAMATATQDEPDYRIFQFLATPGTPEYFPNSASDPAFPTRYWRNVEENTLSLRGDLTIPLPSYNEEENRFKAGVALSDSGREYFQRGFYIQPSGGGSSFNTSGDPQDYLDPANYPYINYYNFPANITYQGKQTIRAGYLMGDWATLKWLRLVGGVRLEQTDLSLSGRNQSTRSPLSPGGIKRTDLLPAVSALACFRTNLQLRAAWSQTVVRPAYREIAPVAIYDIANARNIAGNPNLTFSESANYDLRLEWYPRPGEIVSLSGFVKQLKAPIELIAINANDVRYENSVSAQVYGAELETRTRLGHLWKPLEEFTVGFNAAYIVSEVPISDSQRGRRSANFGETGKSRPLYDQPEYVVNGDLTWEHKSSGTEVTLAGGIVGRRLVVFGLTSPDEYEEPAPQLDLFISQKLGKHWKLKLYAKNLLNPAYEVSQTFPGGSAPVIIKSYTKGMTFGMSAGCEF